MSRAIKGICFDFGDTLADETTEVKDPSGVTLRADLLPGTVDVLHDLTTKGYRLALVADGRLNSYRNVLRQHGIEPCFVVLSASEVVGAEKPSALPFLCALHALGVGRADFGKTVMVGNRVDRDVKGSNALGMISVLLTSSTRYRLRPSDEAETPDYVIRDLTDLPEVLERIELKLRRRPLLRTAVR